MKNKIKNIIITIAVLALVFAFAALQLNDENQESDRISADAISSHHSDVKEAVEPSPQAVEPMEVIDTLEERISNTLQKYVNREAWFFSDSTWEFYLLNQEAEYEYYTKRVIDEDCIEGYYDDIAVLFKESIPTVRREIGGPLVNRDYHILAKSDDSWNGDDNNDYRGWTIDTLEEAKDILKQEGYYKLGEGSVSFGSVKEPEYGEITEEKLEIVQGIAKLFMSTIGNPEKKLVIYILDFPISRSNTQILYIADGVYCETQLEIGYRYFKPHSVSEFDWTGYYRKQFKKIAFTIDVTDIENPKIIALPHGETMEGLSSSTGQLYNEPIFKPEMISVSLKENDILETYLESPADFSDRYDLDILYRKGISIMDVSEQEFIRFGDQYKDEVLPGLRLGDTIDAVKGLFGEPQFADNKWGYIGYRTNECYFAIEGDKKVMSIVFVKNYQLPIGYERIISDSLEQPDSFAEILDKYSEYSFIEQLASGGTSVVYPFGIEFHRYMDSEIYVYTNFAGEIVDSDQIVYMMRDSHETRIRKYFYRNYQFSYDQSETGIGGVESPDGKKLAFEYTWARLYDRNNMYIHSLDGSFAPRKFRLDGWIDQLEWINDEILLFSDTNHGVLGFYSFIEDKLYKIDQLMKENEKYRLHNFTSIAIDRENQIVSCECEVKDDSQNAEDKAVLLLIRYDVSDRFSYNIEISPMP